MDMSKVSYLPLSHIAGLQFDLINTMLYGSRVYFARPDALQGSLVESLKWARPTLFLAVPRIWEKFEDRLKEAGQQSPGFIQSISAWAKAKAHAKVMKQVKGEADWGLQYHIASYYISMIKRAIGLDQTILFFYGAAPLK
jgi:long-chain-fatty-acid--CoA ligase ACSBG